VANVTAKRGILIIIVILALVIPACSRVGSPANTVSTTEPVATLAVASTEEPTPKPTLPAGGLPSPARTEPAITPTEKPAESFGTIPKNFFVSDDVWNTSSILRKADGTPFGGIGFSDIAVGTKLYAPIGGYTTIFTVNTSSGAEYTAIALAEDADWTSDNLVGRYLVFRADGLDVLANEASKGEAFAEVRENGEIYSGSYDRKTVLAVNLDAEWAEMIDSSIEDAGFYMASAIKEIELK